jgi:hypothetical protein
MTPGTYSIAFELEVTDSEMSLTHGHSGFFHYIPKARAIFPHANVSWRFPALQMNLMIKIYIA